MPTDEERETSENRCRNFVMKNLNFLISIIVTIVIVGIISNQVVQPMFSPRLSTFTVTEPLYVQSQIENKIEYYKVFKVSYEIEPALFGSMPQNLTISLPGKLNRDIFSPTSDIEFISQLREANPYANIMLPQKLNNDNFIDIEKLGGDLKVVIYTNGWDIKKFTLDLFFREQTEINEADKTSPIHRWWSTSTISPESPIIIENYYMSPIVYAILNRDDGKYMYELKALVLENKNDIEVRGYAIPIFDNTIRVCEGSVGLNIKGYKGGDYIDLDLFPHETRTILFFKTIPENTAIPSYRTINITSVWCGDLVNSFNRYFSV